LNSLIGIWDDTGARCTPASVGALTNFIGNAVAAIVVARSEGEVAMDRLRATLDGSAGEFDVRDSEQLRTGSTGYKDLDEAGELTQPDGGR
jgi:hypothetical protein